MITRMVDGVSVNLENEVSGQVVDWLMRKFDESKAEVAALKTEMTQKNAEISALKAAAAAPPQLTTSDVRSMAFGDAARRAAPGSVTELEDDEDPHTAYKRRLVATSGAEDGDPHPTQVFIAKNMPTPRQEAAHWSTRATGLRDSGKLKIVTGDKDSRHAWMDSQSGGSILTRRKAV